MKTVSVTRVYSKNSWTHSFDLLSHHEHHSSSKLLDRLGLDAMHFVQVSLQQLLSLEESLLTHVAILQLMLFPPVLAHALRGVERLLTHVTLDQMLLLYVAVKVVLRGEPPGAVATELVLMHGPHVLLHIQYGLGTVVTIVAGGVVAGQAPGTLHHLATQAAGLFRDDRLLLGDRGLLHGLHDAPLLLHAEEGLVVQDLDVSTGAGGGGGGGGEARSGHW